MNEDEIIKRAAANGGGSGAGAGAGANPVRVWHPSSRIIRVSRATGGKDRHSKVWTSKGLRDRRVRLAVNTAIHFYDLQDRLGYDQPSKAVEWLIKAAADSIAELPELSNSFPDTPKQLSDEKRASEEQGQLDSADIESETSKNSSLSLSRSEKKKEHESIVENHQNGNPISQNSSFTELLTCGIGNNSTSPAASAHTGRQWPVSPQMDYFTTSALLEPPSSGFPGQIQLGNSLPQSSIQPFTVLSDQSHQQHQELKHFSFVPNPDQQHQELKHFSFVPNPDQHLTSQQGQGGHDYNLNFTISSSLAGLNRGTLQSNSPSFLPHQLHRFSSIDGSPFYIGPPQPRENHHFFYGGDGTRSSDHKGKGKN